ncbi:glycine cleavage system H protein [Opitutia bacterium]|jgi:glycine cleavage system H protein|nr:glycine cleavage system H protein [Opitutae bacterium]
MSNVPADLHYTKDHEWIKVAADGTAVIGITDHAQAALGDVTFVDLPKAGKTFGAGEVFGAVESVKAASDLYSPVSCEVLEANGSLNDTPDLVNREPYGGAWMIKVKVRNPGELAGLLDAAGYAAIL